MENELIKYREIQRVTFNSESLHNKITNLEFKRREREPNICENKQEFLNRVYSNKMILCTKNNIQLAKEAYQYVSNKINEFEILNLEDKRLNNMLKENKYNFEVAGQN